MKINIRQCFKSNILDLNKLRFDHYPNKKGNILNIGYLMQNMEKYILHLEINE